MNQNLFKKTQTKDAYISFSLLIIWVKNKLIFLISPVAEYYVCVSYMFPYQTGNSQYTCSMLHTEV